MIKLEARVVTDRMREARSGFMLEGVYRSFYTMSSTRGLWYLMEASRVRMFSTTRAMKTSEVSMPEKKGVRKSI